MTSVEIPASLEPDRTTAGSSFSARTAAFSGSKGILVIWALAVAAIWGLALGVASSSSSHNAQSADPIRVLSSWDGEQFGDVAVNGYSTELARQKNFAGFPLLPFASRAIGGKAHAMLAGILLNQLLLLASLILLARLSRVDQTTPLRANPSFWLLISPVGFYLSVYYSESLFLFFTLATVIAYRKDKLWLAFLAGLLAGLSRPTAIALPLLFVWDIYKRRHHDKQLPARCVVAFAPWIGIGAYVAYVGYRMHDPFAYSHIQTRVWGRAWAIPFHPIIREAHAFVSAMLNGGRYTVAEFVQVFSTLAAIALLAWGWRKIDRDYVLYAVGTLVFLHSQFPYGTSDRYELVLFPLFILLALFARPRPTLARIAAVASICVQVILFLRYAHRLWVA